MLTRPRVLAVLSILLVAIGVMFGGAALGEPLGLRGGGGGSEGDMGPLTSDPTASAVPRALMPGGRWSVADARAFDGFPVFWAGEEYGGLPLTEIIRAEYIDSERPGISVREGSVGFLYGSCVITSYDGGCPPPFQVIVQSTCQSPPGLVTDSMTEEPFVLRGALAQEYANEDGHLRLWTQDVSLSIFGPDKESMRALAEALRPLNSLASVEPDGDLKPPVPIETLDCPPLSPGTLPDNPSGTFPITP